MKAKDAKRYDVNGLSLTFKEWSARLGISEITLRRRVAVGWPLEKVFSKPVDAKKSIYADRRRLCLDGRNLSVWKWAKETGISPQVVNRRLADGWSDEEALTTPVKRSAKVYAVGEECHTLREWSQLVGIPDGTIRSRLALGWSLEEALTTVPIANNKPKVIEFAGESHNIAEWGRVVGRSRAMISRRLIRGMEIGEALTAPLASIGNMSKRKCA